MPEQLPRLYLDECITSKKLASLLRKAGFSVTTVQDTKTAGASDLQQFELARKRGWVFVTKNPKDFAELGHTDPEHPGTLAVYQDNVVRDMSYEDIAEAIEDVVTRGLVQPGCFIVLNHYKPKRGPAT